MSAIELPLKELLRLLDPEDPPPLTNEEWKELRLLFERLQDLMMIDK